MASKQENTVEEKANAVVSFIKSSYETGIKTTEDISVAVWNVPANILEGMGVDEDKTKAIKDVNQKIVGGVYSGVDKLTRKGTSIAFLPWKGVGNAISKLRGNGAAKPKAKKAVAKVTPKPKAKAKPKTTAKKAAAPKKAKAAASKAKSVEKKAAAEAAA